MAKKPINRSTRKTNSSSQNAGVTDKKWTVMIYMAAGKDEQTERAALADIKELEKADTTKMNILVQIDRQWPVFPQLFRIRDGASHQIHEPRREEASDSIEKPLSLEGLREMSSGSAQPLIHFLQWAKADPDSKAERYLLVLWGHTYGLGFGRDHGDELTLLELKRALRYFEQPGLDILGANTCAMSYAEAAFELRKSARYLVASQISMPFAGWPYDKVVQVIAEKPDISAPDLGSAIVTAFIRSFEEEAPIEHDVSMTLLDLAKADLLAQPVKTLAAELNQAIADKGLRDQVVGAFQDTSHGDVRPLIDLMDLCKNLELVRSAGVKAAARRIQTLLLDRRKLVLEHRADEDLEGLHGIGIFAPGVTGAADLARLDVSEKKYGELELVQQKDNTWTQLAFTALLKDLAAKQQSVAEFVSGAGATTRDDRTGLTQLVMSIDRAFAKLDLALINTKEVLTANFEKGSASRIGGGLAALSPRLGPPYLRLIGPIGPALSTQIFARQRKTGTGKAALRSLDAVTQSLENLEGALANAEKTAKRVLTNSRLGLGDDPDVKPGILGADDPDVKPGILGTDDPDVKPGILGADDPDVKPGILGLLPWLAIPAAGRSTSASGSAGLIGMYRQVAWAFVQLEESVGKLEGTIRASLLPSPDLQNKDVEKRLRDQITQSLREVKDMVTNAKQVTRGVMVDPADGLGPGVQPALRGTGRQYLALAGGLSSRYLRLL